MKLRGTFASRWWVTVASALGMMVGSGSIFIFGFGMFLKPVSQELGLSRGTLGSALVLGTTLIAIGCPIFGLLADRWGLRAVMLWGIALYATSTAAFALLRPSLLALYLVYGMGGLTGAFQTPIGYSKAISAWFDKERGLALGIATAGVGLGTAFVTQLSGFLIQRFGWRIAYLGLGVAVLALAFVPVALFIREPDAARPARHARDSADIPVLRGLSVSQALRGSWRFWALTVAFFFGVASSNGTITHVVALLTDRGVPLQTATTALSAAGLAIIVGRVLSGYCLDRFFGPYVAIVFFVAPMAGIALLGSGRSGAAPILGTVLCGMGTGAEVGLMAFFISRYFGLRSFAQIYGWMFGVFNVGTGLGPYLMGVSYDRAHSYQPMFVVFEVALALACVLMLRLGPYPFPPGESRLAEVEGKAAV